MRVIYLDRNEICLHGFDRQGRVQRVWVTFEYIGEGLHDEYNKTDPEDRPLLRFYVTTEDPDRPSEGPFDVEDGSACTLLDVRAPDYQRMSALLCLAFNFWAAVLTKQSIKKITEQMSFLDEGWFPPPHIFAYKSPATGL